MHQFAVFNGATSHPPGLYGSPIWRPYYKNKIDLLEKVQHRAIRQMEFLAGIPMDRFCHEYTKLNKKFDYLTN